MRNCVFYFAYGSNMNPIRMKERVPNARRVGTGRLIGWKVRERLYANIEPCVGGRVDGVVYLITETELNCLDRFEGYPHVYTCRRMPVWLNDGGELGGGMKVPCITYVMTRETKERRQFERYPTEYRRICSLGARINGLPDIFETKRDKALREAYEDAIN